MKAFIHIALEEQDAKTETLTVIDGKTGEVLAELHNEAGQCVVDVQDGDKIVIGDQSAQLIAALETEKTKTAQLTQATSAFDSQIADLTGQLEALKVENEKLKTLAPPAA